MQAETESGFEDMVCESGFADMTQGMNDVIVSADKPRRHPAKFTDVILEEAAQMLLPLLPERGTLYDPFAGVGKGVDFMYNVGFDAWGTELEPEWAWQSKHVYCCDSLEVMSEAIRLLLGEGLMDVVFTSPCYGNRMADKHVAKDKCTECEGTGQIPPPFDFCRKCGGSGLSERHTYTHALGHQLSENNAGAMQWGVEYREFHAKAWALVYGVLRPGGYFLLNIKDHIRNGEQVPVTAWHASTALNLGFQPSQAQRVVVTGNGFGQNRAVRVGFESLLLFRKPL